MHRNERISRACTALFFVLLTLVGLLTVRDYTGSYDEIAEQVILSSNMREYALALEKIGITWDEWLESNTTPISQSIEKDHGVSGYYLYGLIHLKVLGNDTIRYTLWNAITWLWFMLGVWSLYAVAREMNMSRLLSCAAALLLYLSPRLFADGHLNNKDVVLLCQMLAVLWQGGRYLKKPTAIRGILFSMIGAAATNTKIVAALAWGLVMAAQVIMQTVKRKWNKPFVWSLIAACAAYAGFYALLTPAMWNDPLGFFPYLIQNAASFSRWEGRLFFRGASFLIPKNPLPVYYLAYMMLTTLPVYVSLLFAIGQLKVVCDILRRPSEIFHSPTGWLLICATGCWLAPMAAFVFLRPVLYNGWRHFYFVFAGTAVLAVYGIKVLAGWSSRNRRLRQAVAAVLCLCFAAGAAGMAINHPRQSSYYNMLASKATMETDYWNTSGTYALERLKNCRERNQDLPLEVGCYFFDLRNACFKMTDEEKAAFTITVSDESPYLYYIEHYARVYDAEPPEGYRVLFTVESYGRLVGTMYERVEE